MSNDTDKVGSQSITQPNLNSEKSHANLRRWCSD